MTPTFTPLADDAIEFLSDETGIDFSTTDFEAPRWFCVTARHDTGTLMGVLACEFKTWFDVHFSCAIRDPRCLSRRLLRTIFKALFSRAVRITALVSPDNERAINQMRRMGFLYEGFLRMGVEGNRDALMFGMLRSECRYLPYYRPLNIPAGTTLGGFNGFLT